MTHQYGDSPGQHSPGQQQGDGELKARAQQVGGQAKAQAEARLDQQKQGAAERLDRLASSVRAAAGELEQQDDEQLSQYVSRFAGTLGELADSLRSKNVDELMRDLRGIARRNPGLFVAGSVAIGFGLARFARASGQHAHGQDAYASARNDEADAMGAWALDGGGSSGGYRGSLSSHGSDGMAGDRTGLYPGSTATGASAPGGTGLGSGTGGTGTGLGGVGGTSAGRTPPTTRGGSQP